MSLEFILAPLSSQDYEDLVLVDRLSHLASYPLPEPNLAQLRERPVLSPFIF